jgi:hypothetical protein
MRSRFAICVAVAATFVTLGAGAARAKPDPHRYACNEQTFLPGTKPKHYEPPCLVLTKESRIVELFGVPGSVRKRVWIFNWDRQCSLKGYDPELPRCRGKELY